ncbi:glycosyltransferase family 39 protein, partial [bacterium]|nr:glycosyltransferase family 39 protein [bacterium]
MQIVKKYHLRKTVLFASIIIFAILLRHQYFSVPIIIVDEALYSEIANVILDGGVPYRDAWEQKPPGIYFLYALIFFIFGRNNLMAVHLIAALAIALTAIGIFCFASIILSKRTAVISAFLYCAISSCGSAAHFQAANTEIFSVMFAAWAVFFFFTANKKFSRFFLCGAFTAISFLFKQPGGLIILLFTAHLF